MKLKFHFLDRVVVRTEFYRGAQGIVVECIQFGTEPPMYGVALDDVLKDRRFFSAKDLELISAGGPRE